MIKRIKYLIDNKCGGNQAEFARKILVSPGNVNNWLKGYSKPGLDAIIHIHEQFNVSFDWIIEGKTAKEEAYKLIDAQNQEIDELRSHLDKYKNVVAGLIDLAAKKKVRKK